MGISCGATLIKYLLFFFNLLWLALGGAILYFGFKITSFSGDFQGVVDSNMKTGAIVVLAAGFVIFLIAFLGCCGAIKENSCMLSVYGAIILILVIVQCVGAYLAFKYRTDLKAEITNGIAEEFKKFKDDPEARKAVNKFQSSFECCGSANFTDWDKILKPEQIYPGSCCKGKNWENNEICNRADVVKDGFKGCVDTVSNTVEKALGGLGGIAIGLVLIQLLIIVSACCLAREVR